MADHQNAHISHNVPMDTSSIGPVVVVITVLSALMMYIYKITNDARWLDSDTQAIAHQLPAQRMGKVHNPFVVTIQEPSKASFTDGICLSIKSQVSCLLLPLWGVNIARVYETIHLPWTDFLEGFTEGLLHPRLEGHVLHAQEIISVPSSPSSSEVHLHPPKDIDMGSPPRDKYPLVIVLLDRQVFSSESAQDHGDAGPKQVASLVCLIHVKDSACPGESQIISQFARIPNARVFNLQQLYMAGERREEENTSGRMNNSSSSQTTDPANSSNIGGDPNNDDPNDLNQRNDDPNNQPSSNSNSSVPGIELCVVCQTRSVSRVSLPCRHACSCHVCFPRLDKCPMCRCNVDSYFSIRSEEEEEEEEDFMVEEMNE